MKTTYGFCIALSLGLATTSLASAGAFLSGAALMKLMDANSRVTEKRVADSTDYTDAALGNAYIQGVSDSFGAIATCMPDGVTSKQLMAITKKYLTAHPEQWQFNGGALAGLGLKEAFPCKKN